MVELPTFIIGALKSNKSLIHKEKKIVLRGTIFFFIVTWRELFPVEHYRPNLTNNTFTSAGETPGIRDA